MALLIIIITAICMFLGLLLLLLEKKPEIFFIGLLGTCFLLYHVSTFNEKDLNKLFEYQRKDNDILEIKTDNPLLKGKAEFKIIENNDKIILKNTHTGQESEALDKEVFFSTIKINN